MNQLHKYHIIKSSLKKSLDIENQGINEKALIVVIKGLMSFSGPEVVDQCLEESCWKENYL